MNLRMTRANTILVAEDDPDDRLLIEEALKQSGIPKHLQFVPDGEEMMDYMLRRKKYEDPETSPRPDIIFLDLNMPKKTGFEVLQEIKSNPGLRHIPIVVLTTSRIPEDIDHCYDLGANSYITKQATFECISIIVDAIGKYWFEIVALPPQGES